VIALIKRLLVGSGASRAISLVAKADHVELTSVHLVIGLQMGWLNRTHEPIPIKEVRVLLYLHGRREVPLRLYPLERFTRVTGREAMRKSPVGPFTLPPREIHTEYLRFISQEVLDIAPGSYAVDVKIMDTDDKGYTSRTKFRLDSKIRYRRSEEWEIEDN
jgi:hypothetical protein